VKVIDVDGPHPGALLRPAAPPDLQADSLLAYVSLCPLPW